MQVGPTSENESIMVLYKIIRDRIKDTQSISTTNNTTLLNVISVSAVHQKYQFLKMLLLNVSRR